MQAVVKTPHIEIKIRGKIPPKLLSLLQEEYGEAVKLAEDSNEDMMVNIFETDWYKALKKMTTPGDNMRIYRKMHRLTQKQLGEKLGGIPRQHISRMEHGLRVITLEVARNLSKVFNVPVEKFI